MDRLKIKFRIEGISAKQAAELGKIVGEVPINISAHHKKSGVNVLSFDLDRKNRYQSLEKFIKESSFPESSYGFYIYLSSSSDNTGFRLPTNVKRLFVKIGGNLDIGFAYTPNRGF